MMMFAILVKPCADNDTYGVVMSCQLRNTVFFRYKHLLCNCLAKYLHYREKKTKTERRLNYKNIY